MSLQGEGHQKLPIKDITSKTHLSNGYKKKLVLSSNMLSTVLILSFIIIEASILLKGLKELENLWIHSQVLIYYNSKPSEDLKLKEPDCFGNLVTVKFVKTAASCFMNVEDILKYSETHNKKPRESYENLIISQSIKKGCVN